MSEIARMLFKGHSSDVVLLFGNLEGLDGDIIFKRKS